MGFSWKAIAGLLLVSTMAAGHAQTASQDAGTTASTPQNTDASSIEAQIENLRQAMDAQRAEIDRLQRQLQESNSKALQTQQVKLTTEIEHPDAIHYKGITISPGGSFIEAATVYRSAATGDDINTHFTAIPLENSAQAQLSEFKGSGRQSRIALKADGKLHDVDMTAYYEMDWLSAGVTSNNNQSNSYTVRQRQLWARAAFTSGWNVSGGQMWSLATETTHGLDNGTEILPGTIDPQYTAGYVWTRQYGFRVTKDFAKKFWLGVSLENAQALPGGSNPANEFLGQSGDTGGLYDNQSTYSYNRAPDVIAKVAFEPGWGHWELFGIGRFFYNRIYPNAPTSSTGAYNDTVTAGGIGGGFRAPLAHKKLSIGLKGLWGEGIGRYGDSTIADITFRKDGTISPLHGFSALSTVEMSPTKRLGIYLNYGGDYIGRDLQNGGTSGYGLYSADMSGCNTEGVPGNATTPPSGTGTGTCAGNNKDVQEFSSGYWYNFYDGPKGRFRYGLQYSYFTRNLWSGAGGATNPGGGAKGTDNIFETSLRYYLP